MFPSYKYITKIKSFADYITYRDLIDKPIEYPGWRYYGVNPERGQYYTRDYAQLEINQLSSNLTMKEYSDNSFNEADRLSDEIIPENYSSNWSRVKIESIKKEADGLVAQEGIRTHLK